jgi:hypothetical protein
MKIIVRTLEIDTAGDPDLNLAQVKIASLFRACFAPVEPARPPALAPPLAAPAAIAAPDSEAKGNVPSTEHAVLEAKTNGHEAAGVTDRCECGRPKSANARMCQHCAGRQPALARARARVKHKAHAESAVSSGEDA